MAGDVQGRSAARETHHTWDQGSITPGIREPSHLGIRKTSHLGIRDVAALVAQVWQPVSAAREALAVVSVPLALQCARRALLARP